MLIGDFMIISKLNQMNINFNPVTVQEEIAQNLFVLLTTLKGSVPLDRNFGLNQKFIDKPISAAQQLLIAEIYDTVEKYEPRVEIVDISFDSDSLSGILFPVLEVKILDKYLP